MGQHYPFPNSNSEGVAEFEKVNCKEGEARNNPNMLLHKGPFLKHHRANDFVLRSRVMYFWQTIKLCCRLTTLTQRTGTPARKRFRASNSSVANIAWTPYGMYAIIKIVAWEVEFTDEFEEWWHTLSETEQEK